MNSKKFLSGAGGLILASLTCIIFLLSSDNIRDGVNEIVQYEKISYVTAYMGIFIYHAHIIILCAVAGYLLGIKIYEAIVNKGVIKPEIDAAQKRITRIRILWGFLGSIAGLFFVLFASQGLAFFAPPLLIAAGMFGYFIGAKLGQWMFE